ncbi:MAG: fimbrillin family protein [Bacteroidaceae bacterium]|nr:fimbrillin family protein [Bacteroidaceae bacterium]
MKKSYLMIAAAAILTACGNQSMIDDIKSEPAEISFETFAEKQTKADPTAENSGASSHTALEGHHTTFKVWGAKDATTHQTVYAADAPGTVTYSTSETKWTAAPIKFWDKTATRYYFYAAAPASQSWGFAFTSSSDMSDGTITLADYKLTGVNVRTTASTTATESWKTNGGADLDLMIASPCPVERTAYNKTTTPDKVNLNFNHILSRLNVLVKKGNNIKDSKVSLIELKVEKLKNKGSFNEKPTGLTTEQLAAGTIARWATPTIDGTYEPAAISLTATSKDNGVTTTAQYVLETLIMPQNVVWEDIDASGSSTETQAYVYLKYSIDDEEFYGYYNLAAAFNATVDNTETANVNESLVPFNEGWQNKLTITINPAEIEFDAEVFDWSTYATEGAIQAY